MVKRNNGNDEIGIYLTSLNNLDNIETLKSQNGREVLAAVNKNNRCCLRVSLLTKDVSRRRRRRRRRRRLKAEKKIRKRKTIDLGQSCVTS